MTDIAASGMVERDGLLYWAKDAPKTLDEWVEDNVLDLSLEIDTHMSMVDLSKEDSVFLKRMIMISVRSFIQTNYENE